MNIISMRSVIVGTALLLVACGKEEDKKKPSLEVVAPSGDDGIADTGGDSSKDEPTLSPLTLGEETSVKGDVVKDENGLYSITALFNLSLAESTLLKVQKGFSNGNCGPSTASFIIMSGDEQLADVTIDYVNNEYDGVPAETFTEPVAAGDYMLVAFITLVQECKNMLYYYDFTLKQAAR